jgi:HD-like signal output (HDOD) protein
MLIVVTGVTEARLLRDLERRGVDALFRKPINVPEFGVQIREMLDRRRTAQPGRPDGVLAEPGIGAERLPGDAVAGDAGRTVVVFLRDRPRSQRLASLLAGDCVQVVLPETTDDLCHFAEQQRVDVIVIEDAAYGFLDGAEILLRLRDTVGKPRAVVLGDATAANAERLASLNVRKIFPHDASNSDLVQAVRSALVEVERSTVLISPEARALVKSFGEPAHSPAVLMKLAPYLQMTPAGIEADQLARDIRGDAASTAELLRLANGSSLGVRRPITEVTEAIRFLGAGRAVALLLSSAVRNTERTLLRRLSPALRSWYQMRSILIASICSVFAERHFELSGDTAFVLGLFQDLGLLVMADVYGERYTRVIEHARSVGPVRLHATEQQYFGINHAEVSAALVELWRLPNKLVLPIRHHHDLRPPIADRLDPLAFLQPMRIGEAFADLWDNRHPNRKDAASKLMAACPQGRYSDYQQSLDEALRRTGEVAELFLLPLPDEDAALAVCRDVLAGYAEACGDAAVAEELDQR